MNVDRVILAVHILAKVDRMDRVEIIEEIGSYFMLVRSNVRSEFGQKDETKGVTH